MRHVIEPLCSAGFVDALELELVRSYHTSELEKGHPLTDHRRCDLSSDVAIISGCGGETGIGFACARTLAQLGARVAMTATTEGVHIRAEELRGQGAEPTNRGATTACRF
jgi:NAD(P)H-hydrate repair Nnr-like enzyme with NAD(P)H-hydrate epimerase domain